MGGLWVSRMLYAKRRRGSRRGCSAADLIVGWSRGTAAEVRTIT